MADLSILVEEMAPKSSKIGKGFNTVTVVADQIRSPWPVRWGNTSNEIRRLYMEG